MDSKDIAAGSRIDQVFKNTSPELKNLLKLMLQFDPSQRMKSEQLVELDLFNELKTQQNVQKSKRQMAPEMNEQETNEDKLLKEYHDQILQ